MEALFCLQAWKRASNIAKISQVMLLFKHNFWYNAGVLRVTLQRKMLKFSSIMLTLLDSLAVMKSQRKLGKNLLPKTVPESNWTQHRPSPKRKCEIFGALTEGRATRLDGSMW